MRPEPTLARSGIEDHKQETRLLPDANHLNAGWPTGIINPQYFGNHTSLFHKRASGGRADGIDQSSRSYGRMRKRTHESYTGVKI